MRFRFVRPKRVQRVILGGGTVSTRSKDPRSPGMNRHARRADDAERRRRLRRARKRQRRVAKKWSVVWPRFGGRPKE